MKFKIQQPLLAGGLPIHPVCWMTILRILSRSPQLPK